MIKQAATMLLFSTAACSTVGSQSQPQSTYAGSSALTAALGPCNYVNAEGESMTSLAVGAASKGLDLLIGALKDAADPQKGKASNIATTSLVLSKSGPPPNCLFVAKGAMTVFPEQEFDPNAPQGLNFSSEGTAEPTSSSPDTDGMEIADVIEGADSLPGVSDEPSTRSESNNSTYYNRAEDFKKAGLYFAEQPSFAAVFAIDRTKDHKAVRLRPVYLSYHDASPGALFRFGKERDLAVTLKLTPLGKTQMTMGPLTLGRVKPTDGSLIVYSTFADKEKRSLTSSPWVAVPDGAFDEGGILNAEVVLTEIQAPNRVAGYVAEVIDGSKEELNTEIKLAIDSDAAKAAALEKMKADATLINSMNTAIVKACSSTAKAKELIDGSKDGILAALFTAEADQRDANIAAIAVGQDPGPFNPSLQSASPTASALSPSVCDPAVHP